MSADGMTTPAPAHGRRAAPGRESVLTIVQVYPHLLGTYGDAGNAMVLRRRAADRGIPVEVVAVQPGEALPRNGNVYLLGGGEDAKQTAAAAELRADGGLAAAVARGAAVLGICAGYQLLGETFLGVGGVPTQGLGLLDVRTDRLERRAVGNVLANPGWELELDELIGFENHGGLTTLGPDARPLAKIEVGIGNGDETGSEGAVTGHVVGTYLHGPVLALNPTLADWLLATVTGSLPALPDTLVERLRRHRLDEVIPETAKAGRRKAMLSAIRRKDDGPSGATATLSGAPAETPGS
ncbi:MAG TPA: glutamine amidotransferase [Kineosporiaceae bacterium]|nr:glutamine amidotransferase [Kineosporiaceae bacterium]